MVLEECIACGQCILMTDLLVETAEGKAAAASKGYIDDSFMAQAQDIVSDCPAQALRIIEVGQAQNIGGKGLAELKTALENQLRSFKFPSITTKHINFKADNYAISVPFAQGEYNYAYSSESGARRAGKEEFDRILYSQYRPIILSVFVQYKNDKLQPFYTCERTEKSFYYGVNREIEKILQAIATEAEAVTNGKCKLPQDFTEFNVYPNHRKDGYLDIALKGFENRSTQSGIIAALKDLSHTSLNDYAEGIDTDDSEEYDGEGFFGNSKYKTKWCYSGIQSVCEDYIKDLKWAMDYVDIDEAALEVVNSVVNEYIQEAKKAIESKIAEFSKVKVVSEGVPKQCREDGSKISIVNVNCTTDYLNENDKHKSEAKCDKNGLDSGDIHLSGTLLNPQKYDIDGYDPDGYDKDGYNRRGYNRRGCNRGGYDKDGYDRDGYDISGYDKEGYNRNGYMRNGYDRDGYDKDGCNRSGYDRDGYDRSGYGKNGYDRNGYMRNGYDRDGYDKEGYNLTGYNRRGCDRSGYDREGYDREGYNREGYDRNGYNQEGYDQNGYMRNGCRRDVFNGNCDQKNQTNNENEFKENSTEIENIGRMMGFFRMKF